MAEKAEELAAMEAIKKLKSTEAPQFLSPNDEISHCSRLSSRHIFRLLKPHTPKSPFEELLTEGFDAEQIWQQIDIQSQPLISSLKREIKRFERNPNQISSLFDGDEENEVSEREFEENDDDGLEIDDEDDEEDDNSDNDDVNDEVDDDDDEEEDEEDDDDVDDDDEDGVPEVEDDFLKINELEKFLRREEKKEYGGDDEVKTKTKKKKREIDNKNEGNEDDEESESDDDLGDAGINELLMYGGDDDEDEAQYNIRYEEFYLPNKKTPKSGRKHVKQSDDMDMEDEEKVMPKRKQKQVTEVGESDESDGPESDGPESDDGDETEDNKNLSTHEKERQKLQAKIKQMEEANLAAKDWTMQGEVTASKRPRDSALEVDLDFEHNVRPPPVITEEVTTSLEDMIKKRISEGHFDDVQKAPKLPSAAPKEKKELDDNKSKKGLAEIYEEEYAKQTGIGTVPLSHNDELRKEATGLFKRLCLKLDALSHFHFAPKPVVEDMTIQTNVPALAMEEIASVAVSDAAMLAPEEVYAGKGDIKEDTELTKEDRKKRRASKKRKFKAINAARTANRPADKPLLDNGEAKEV